MSVDVTLPETVFEAPSPDPTDFDVAPASGCIVAPAGDVPGLVIVLILVLVLVLVRWSKPGTWLSE